MMPKQIRTKILVVFYIISAIPLIGYLILYFQLREQNNLTTQFIEKQQPVTLNWVQLMNGINHSLAAQRGWVLFGTESFRKEREETWEKEINPILESLKSLYAERSFQIEHAEEVRRFYDIRLSLIELKNIQDEITEIARTPQNIPSQQLFERVVSPAFETMVKNLNHLTTTSSASQQAPELLHRLTSLHAATWNSIDHLENYLEDGLAGTWETFQDHWQSVERFLLSIKENQDALSPLHRSHLTQLSKNHDLIEERIKDIFELRSQPTWNVAYHKMVVEALPLVEGIEESIEKIVKVHSQIAHNDNQKIQNEFTRWRNLFLTVALSVFLLGLVLARFLGNQVARPLRELRDTVRQVKDDDFYGSIEVSTYDEVGELAQEFQEMLDALSDRTRDANRTRQILENSPFPVMLATPDRELIYINPAAIREFKKLSEVLPAAPEEMLGQNLNFLTDLSSINDQQLSTPYTLPPTTDILIGSQVVEVTFSPLFDSQSEYIGPIVHWKNATQERQSEQDRLQLVQQLKGKGEMQEQMVNQLESQNQQLIRQLQLDQAQSKIAKAISSLEVDAIAQTSLETLVRTTNAQAGILYLYDSAQGSLVIQHYHSIDMGTLDDELYQVEGLPKHVFETQAPVTIRNPEAHERKSFHLGVVQSCPEMIVAYPLLFQKNCMGVLLLSSVSEFGESMIRFIENTVSQLSVSLHNAETFKTVQQQQQSLQAANLELEAATRLKSEFLANMSHELRTPLNAVIGFADALLDIDEENPLNDYQSDRLGRIHQSGKHLLELINSILDLSKIEAGKMEVSIYEFDTRELCEEVIGLMESLISKKPVKLKLNIADTLPRCTNDGDKIRQIIINLVGNAIKFTKEGQIMISIQTIEAGMIQIDVVDTGCGIAEDQLGSIFEAFRQADGSSTRYYEGTGLGLTLVKRMSELIGGHVSAQSKLGEGSTFSIAFPANYASQAD